MVKGNFVCFQWLFWTLLFERIMTGALEDHEGPVRIGGRIITNLRFCPCRRRRRAYLVSQPTGQGINNIWYGDQCRKDWADDQHHQRNQLRQWNWWLKSRDCSQLQILCSVMTDEGSRKKFCPGLPKQLVYCQSSRPCALSSISEWWVPWSFQSSYARVKYELLQQRERERYKLQLQTQDASEDFWASPTEIMLRMKKWGTVSGMLLRRMKTSSIP